MEQAGLPPSGGILIIVPTLLDPKVRAYLQIHPDLLVVDWKCFDCVIPCTDLIALPEGVTTAIVYSGLFTHNRQEEIDQQLKRSGIVTTWFEETLNKMFERTSGLLAKLKQNLTQHKQKGTTINMNEVNIAPIALQEGQKLLVAVKQDNNFQAYCQNGHGSRILVMDYSRLIRLIAAPDQEWPGNVQALLISPSLPEFVMRRKLADIASSKGTRDIRFVDKSNTIHEILRVTIQNLEEKDSKPLSKLSEQELADRAISRMNDTQKLQAGPTQETHPTEPVSNSWKSQVQFVRDHVDFEAKPATDEIKRLLRLAHDSGQTKVTMSGLSATYYALKKKRQTTVPTVVPETITFQPNDEMPASDKSPTPDALSGLVQAMDIPMQGKLSVFFTELADNAHAVAEVLQKLEEKPAQVAMLLAAIKIQMTPKH